jgi:hypothetical protein
MFRLSFLSQLQALTLGLKGKAETCSHYLLNIILYIYYTIKIFVGLSNCIHFKYRKTTRTPRLQIRKQNIHCCIQAILQKLLKIHFGYFDCIPVDRR